MSASYVIMIPPILHSHSPVTILATEKVIDDAFSTRPCRFQNYFSNKPKRFDSWVRFVPSDYHPNRLKTKSNLPFVTT